MAFPFVPRLGIIHALFVFANYNIRRRLYAEPGTRETPWISAIHAEDNRYPTPRPARGLIKDSFADGSMPSKIGLNSPGSASTIQSIGRQASRRHPGAAAGATTKLRLAPAVTLLRCTTAACRQEWATLDLRRRRIDFAAGRGSTARSTSRSARRSRNRRTVRRGLEIVWRAGGARQVVPSGKFYQFKDIEVRPRPAQKPLGPMSLLFAALDGAAARNDWN